MKAICLTTKASGNELIIIMTFIGHKLRQRSKCELLHTFPITDTQSDMLVSVDNVVDGKIKMER